MADSRASLERFSAPTREWFGAAFAEPTAAQAGAWEAIADGRHALVVAPTGSGKTLSAFLWAIDRLLTQPGLDRLDQRRSKGTRVLYISPLKALAVDVERNLRAPLIGIRQTAERLGARLPDVTVGIRSGDTPAAERRTLARTPPDILITTPESLFLMLTSQARESLRTVETVIVDEVHAVAGTKRGTHLGITLERLDALLPKPAQRIGLSATVRPLEEVARFLGGTTPVEIVAPPSAKQWDLRVVVPVEDMTQPGEYDDSGDSEDDGREAASIWPHVENHVADLIGQHRSTIVFANSRRLAERLTARLNEIAAERAGVDVDTDGPPPAQVMAQSGTSYAAAPVIAKAHHGSVSKEQRAIIEDDLKRGRLPCVVATSSLELGIDMGAVDLVIQIESPPSVASALQRVGRAGHQVGEVSRGVLFPKHRGDLAQTAVAVQRMRDGADRGAAHPHEPARRAGPAGRRHGGDGGLAVGRRVRPGAPLRVVHRAAPRRLRRHARPSQRPLSERRVRRAPTSCRLGPRHRAAHRPARRTTPGRHQRRHHPRPRPVRCLPGGRRGSRPARRRARRGDGLRVAGRRHLRPGCHQLADRGHHPRPRAGDARPRHPRAPAVLEGRRARPPGRAGRGDRRVHPRPGVGEACGRGRRSRGTRSRRVGRRQPRRLRPRAGRGHRRPAQRPHPGRRAVPRRARRLAARRPLAVRHARARALGAGDQRPAPRAVRR